MSAGLTVIMPFHNLEAMVPTTLAALRRAGDERVEYLLIDDASTDHTADALAAGVDRVPGARLHRLEQNLGLSGVRNLGMELAETDHLTFLDGDDFVSRGYFGALLDAITRLGVPMLRTDHIVVEGRKRTVRRIPTGFRDGRVGSPRAAILPTDQPTAIDHPYAWAGIYHRSLVEQGLLRFDDLRTAEDRPWIWRLQLGVEAFSVPEIVGLHYRRDLPGSLSRAASSTQLDFVRSMQLVVQTVQADPEAERFLPKALRRWCELTLHHLAHLDRFTPEVRRTFTTLLGSALAEVPAEPLAETLAAMTPDRRARITRLMAHAGGNS